MIEVTAAARAATTRTILFFRKPAAAGIRDGRPCDGARRVIFINFPIFSAFCGKDICLKFRKNVKKNDP